MVQADVIAHLRSLASELDSRSSRVRQLIGARHWLSDGHHKEFLLRGMMQRYMPAGVAVAPGFVIDARRPEQCSREQDVLIVDTLQQAPLFSEGGLVVVIPEMLLGHVSVKTTFGKAEIADTIATLSSARAVAHDCACDGDRIWSAGFFYGIEPKHVGDWPKIVEWFTLAMQPFSGQGNSSPYSVVCSCGSDLLCCVRSDAPSGSAMLHLYECDGLAPAVLLALLMDHIHDLRGGTGTAFGSVLNESAIKPACAPVAVAHGQATTAAALPAVPRT